MWMIDDGKPLYGDDDGKTLKWVCLCVPRVCLKRKIM